MKSLVETGATSHPLLVAMIDAQRLNRFSGGTVVSPWDLESGHTLDEWIEAADALSEMPSMRQRKKAQDQFFEQARRSHKDYASLHRRH